MLSRRRSLASVKYAVVCGLALALGIPSGLAAQGAETPYRITGAVHDTAGMPVVHAFLWVSRESKSAIADEHGRFQLDLASGGPTDILVRRIGYAPTIVRVDLTADSTRVFDVVLLPMTTRLAPVEVRARTHDPLASTGFYARLLDRQRGAGNGTFITPEEIELHKPLYITSLFYKAPGIQLKQHHRLGMVPFGAGGCRMTVYIDGARLDPGDMVNAPSSPRIGGARTQPTRNTLIDLPGIDEVVGGNSVAGVEIYPRGVQVPPRFALLNGTCGVIAIWTKS